MITQTAFRVVRTVGFAMSMLVGLTFLLVAWPLSWLNPLLRTLGVLHAALPSNGVCRWTTTFMLWVGGVTVDIQTAESDPAALELLAKGQCIVMYTHSSNLDPLIVISASRCAPKFIYKRELAKVPLLGWVAWIYDHVAIDRANRDAAIAALGRAVCASTAKGQSIAIAPEGTRSRTGELLPFKRGPFHLAHQTNSPVVPLVIRGAFDLLPPKSKMFDSGRVRVTALAPISGGSVDEIHQRAWEAVSSFVDRCAADEAAVRATSAGEQRKHNSQFVSVAPAVSFLGSLFVAYRLLVNAAS